MDAIECKLTRQALPAINPPYLRRLEQRRRHSLNALPLHRHIGNDLGGVECCPSPLNYEQPPLFRHKAEEQSGQGECEAVHLAGARIDSDVCSLLQTARVLRV